MITHSLAPTGPFAAEPCPLFYERDRQARTDPRLIAGPSCPWRSAHSVPGARTGRASGSSEQSSSASSHLVRAPDPFGRTSGKRQLVAWARTMVLSETRLSKPAVTLTRVLRGGLGLGECLGGLWPGRRKRRDFPPHPVSRIEGAAARGPHPHRRLLESGRYCACIVNRAGSYRSPFFQSRSVMAASFRVSVTRASSSFIPRETIAR